MKALVEEPNRMKRGEVLYTSPRWEEDITERKAALYRGILFIAGGVTFFVLAPSVGGIVAGTILLLPGLLILAAGYGISAFKIHENGIRLAGHGFQDIFRRRYIPFSRISFIEVNERQVTMTIHFEDDKNNERSADIWRRDVERDFPGIVDILKGRTELEVMHDG